MTHHLKKFAFFLVLLMAFAPIQAKSAQNRPVLVITDKASAPATMAAYPAATAEKTPSPYAAPVTQPSAAKNADGARPLVKIKFDAPNVDYEQAVYMAMSEAMKKNPNATYDMVAVSPMSGNAAQTAIQSAHARRNAETVLRSLSKMGLNINKIDLRAEQSATAQTNEVHILMR